MKKNKRTSEEQQSKYQHLINQLLTLFFSGIYITTKEMMDIYAKLGYETASKNREILLKNLLTTADKDHKLELAFNELIKIIQKRIESYKDLALNYPNINDISSTWIQRADTTLRLIRQQKRGNPYD